MVETDTLQKLLINIVSKNRAEAKRLRQSKGLSDMMLASGAHGMVSIREFAQRHCSDEGADSPLTDDRWDIVLFLLGQVGASDEVKASRKKRKKKQIKQVSPQAYLDNALSLYLHRSV